MQNIKNIQNIQNSIKSNGITPLQRLYSYITHLSGLVAYYPLNESSGSIAYNKSPSTIGTNDGSTTGATIGQSGQLGKAYSFDGSGDRVVVTSIHPSTTFSFAFAFKRNGTPDANDRIIDQASGGPLKGWHVNLNTDGSASFRTWNNGGVQLSLEYGILADGEWVILSGSIGASSSKIYLNGVEIDSGGGNNFGSGVVADLQFGARSGGTNNAMSGSLQHIAIADNVEWSAAIHEKIANFFFELNDSRILKVNGAPFKTRGWNYSSNYLNGASTNPWYIETNQIPYDAQDISDAGMNVVKIYGTEANETEHLAAIDAMLAIDPSLKFLVLDFVTYGTDYSVATGQANRDAKVADFEAMINIFKQRSSVIGYGFGNENNLNLGATSAADWYSLVDAACAAGKAIDSSRFYFTADGELGTYPGDAALPNLDVLGANIYRGTTFTDILQDIVALTSKPFILTEFGRKRPDNTAASQQTQADEVLDLIQEADSLYPFISGWVHFKFTHTKITDTGDEFWEATAPLSQGSIQSRNKFYLFNHIKGYLK